MDKIFKLKEHGTNVKTEILAGITTFMTMAYILIVNPNILADTGMDKGALFTATALAAAIATLVMAFFANYPIALASGMGLNAFFVTMVLTKEKVTWQIALTVILIEGFIFILLTLFRFREAIVNAIPQNLKYGITVGIGLFIAVIGLKSGGITGNITLPDSSNLLVLGDLKSVTVILALIGVLGTVFMLYKKIKGALLWGILGTYALGILCQLTGLYVIDPAIGRYDLIPTAIFSSPPSLSPIFLKFDFSGAWKLGFDFLFLIFAFLFVDMFDTIGTLIGVGSKAEL